MSFRRAMIFMGGVSYGPYTTAFNAAVITAGGSLTATELTALTVFETSNTNLAELDRLWIHGLSNQVAARISFVNPSSTALTEVNSPTWTANQGYNGNGSSMYLKTNVNINSLTNFQRNSATFGIYSRDGVAENKIIMGCINNYLYPRYLSDGKGYARTTGAIETTYNASDGLSLYTGNRTDALNNKIYNRGVLKNTTASASVAPTATEFYILAYNNSGSPATYSTRQIALSFIGSGAIDQSTFYTQIQTLGTTLGWAV